MEKSSFRHLGDYLFLQLLKQDHMHKPHLKDAREAKCNAETANFLQFGFLCQCRGISHRYYYILEVGQIVLRCFMKQHKRSVRSGEYGRRSHKTCNLTLNVRCLIGIGRDAKLIIGFGCHPQLHRQQNCRQECLRQRQTTSLQYLVDSFILLLLGEVATHESWD